MISTAQDIKNLGTILGIWAHPDDETMSSAGIMATAVNNGQKVICLTATKGEEGSQDESKWPKSKLAIIRQGSRLVYKPCSMLVTDGKQVFKTFTHFRVSI